MPKPVISIVSKVCKLSLEDVEEKWEKAKNLAGDKSKDMKYVMGVFKRSLGKDCVDKLVEKEGWKPVKWEENKMSRANDILERMNNIYEGTKKVK